MSGAKAGMHTLFKQDLTEKLHTRLKTTVKTRAGPSFDERLAKAVKERVTKANALEGEQRKTLSAACEKGRSRPTSCPIRPKSQGPNQAAILAEKQKEMKKQSADYAADIEALKMKMDNRKPLFNVSEVQDVFEQLQRRKEDRRRQLQEEERQTWENIREIENSAHSRPLLIEDPTYRPKPKPSQSEAKAPPGLRPKSAPQGLQLESFECDSIIENAINSRSFKNSTWAAEVARIKERADNRVPLSQMSYPVRRGVNGLNASMMCFNLKFD